jgi:hypothetical protein
MNIWVLRLPYVLLPILGTAYAGAVYLGPGRFSAKRAWSGAILLAAFFTLIAAFVVQQATSWMIASSSVFKAYGTLYGILLPSLTAVALALRSRLRVRVVGVLVLLVTAFFVNRAAQYASGYFLDFVNASG